MSISVDLDWCEGDPCLCVTEESGDLRVVVDPRLSQAQVIRACADLGEHGEEVRRAWEDRVGLSDGRLAS